MNYPKSKEEPALVRELSRGNILAFNTLFRQYGKRLYRFAYGYLKSEDESEELVQEVFTIIWEKRTELREELSFKSFLFTISFNIIRKHFRTRAHLADYINSESSSDSDMRTSQEITYNSLHDYISSLVNELPERRKLIFIKSRFDGLSIKEIADDLKISHKTVENQLTDALKFIRENLNKEGIHALLFFLLFLT
jgi:RNA polymerase sigma-70 factor (ECF subfamily)